MKDLSKSTVSIVVSALIGARLESTRELHEAERMGHSSYRTQIQQALDENATAIRELNEEVAPWLRYHPQLLDVFSAPTISNIEPARAKHE